MVLIVDKGLELVEDERDLVAGGAMDVLREATDVLVVMLVLVVAVAGLAKLVVDEFFLVGVEGGLLADDDRDDVVLGPVVGLV